MGAWFDLPAQPYKPALYLFAQWLPAMNVLDALKIARAKIPQDGQAAFKYFCGVCHSMIRERALRLSRN